MDAFDPDAYLAQAAAAQPVVNPEQLQNVQQSGIPDSSTLTSLFSKPRKKSTALQNK